LLTETYFLFTITMPGVFKGFLVLKTISERQNGWFAERKISMVNIQSLICVHETSLHYVYFFVWFLCKGIDNPHFELMPFHQTIYDIPSSFITNLVCKKFLKHTVLKK